MTRFRLRQPSPLDPRRALPEGLRFYAITTAAKREFAVARWLEAQCDAFTIVPLVYHRLSARNTRRRGLEFRRNLMRGHIESPLIPRIVVAGMELPPSATALAEHNPHIIGVLGINGAPMPMRAGEPERLREISSALMKPTPIYKPGDKVKIVGASSPHAVIEIKSIHGKYAHFIQSWFNQEHEMKIELDKLEAA